MRKIVIASHTALVDNKEYDGIGNTLKANLNEMNVEYAFVRHSMEGKLRSEVQVYKKGRLIKKTLLRVRQQPSILRYIGEVRQSIRYFTKYRADVYIGIDPLNALAAISLKKRGMVEKAIFFTADYSEKRFNNPLLNYIYHAIDRYCIKHADEVWSVSTKICKVRREMGLSEQKNILVPNVPPIAYDDYKKSKHDEYELITTGIIDKQLDFEGSIRAVAAMKNEYPRIHLTIIGNGPEEDSLKELVTDLKIEDRVEFTGRLSLKEALYRQSCAGIGLALYTGIWGFNQYGDSTKCREYFNFSLPIISTETHSTVEDIVEYNAGVIVKLKTDAYQDAIRKIYANYSQYSRGSRSAGKKFSGIHKSLLIRLLEE